MVWPWIMHSIGVCAGDTMTSRSVVREQSCTAIMLEQTRATANNSDMTDPFFGSANKVRGVAQASSGRVIVA
jgi:hypothetical protein